MQLTKEKFANDISELQVKFGLITSNTNSSELKCRLKEALLQFFEQSANVTHKDSKIKLLEEQNKKIDAKSRVLKGNNKELKEKVAMAAEQIEK